MTVFLHHFDDIGLLAEHKLVHHLVDGGGFAVAAVQLVVDDRVVDAVQTEVHQTGQHGLAAFAEQEFFQTVVAERRELDVDLTDNADQFFSSASYPDAPCRIRSRTNRNRCFTSP